MRQKYVFFLFIALPITIALLSPWISNVIHNKYSPDAPCFEGPYCASRYSFVESLKCTFPRYLVDLKHKDYKRDVIGRLNRLIQRNLKGQKHLVNDVMRDIGLKLDDPNKALVFHFAGDNGVGKTTLAQLISLAIGFQCQDVECAIGDSTLVLSGVSYDGYSVQEFRRDVVPRIVRHAKYFSQNGVIIINDLGALHPDLVRVLLPLFGRASTFPEAPSVLLSGLIVIITTDFGREGRTQGKSLVEMRRIVEDDFKSLYTQLSSSMIRTYPFLPISLAAAYEIAKTTIQNFRCTHRDTIKYIQVSDDAVAWIVSLVYEDLPMENGRCVVNAVTAAVAPSILLYVQESHTVPMSLYVGVDNNASIVVRSMHK